MITTGQSLRHSYNGLKICSQYISTKPTDKIQKAIEDVSTINAFKGLIIDLTASKSTKLFYSKNKIYKKVLKKIIKLNQQKDIHVISQKIPSKCSTIMKIAIDCGFIHHHANEKYSWLNLCLSKSHSAADCPYPAYKTVSAGVTGIVFYDGKVLTVKEKVGITKIKPITGGVDYGESQETPLDAVVRELFEEAKIRVRKEDATLVGTAWTNNYRGNCPDISYFYAFVLNEEQVPSAQESEILSVQWIDVEEIKKEPEDEKDKPWGVRHAVIAADAVVNGSAIGWKASTKYLTTGKPIEFYSVIPIETRNRD